MNASRKPIKCRVTGRTLPAHVGRGRPAEYLNDDARQFAFRMSQIGTLLEKLAPEMDEKHVLLWRGEIFALSNRLNRRMNDLRREAVATASDETKSDATT
jgi:hypothetical protein